MRLLKFQRIIVVTTTLLIAITYLASQLGRTSPSNTAEEIPLCTILPSSYEFAEKEEAKWIGNSLLYWPKGTQLKVYFEEGGLALQRKILELANEWSSLSGLHFIRSGLKQNAQIRISFNCRGYNSLVGQQNLDTRYASAHTMCLEGLDKTADQALFRRTVLHEFGHVVGLLHELQHPDARIPWDTAKLYAYYKSTYDWERDSVNKWVLTLYDSMQHGQFDTTSIMIYAVPAAVTTGNYRIAWPDNLSKGDRDFIKQHY